MTAKEIEGYFEKTVDEVMDDDVYLGKLVEFMISYCFHYATIENTIKTQFYINRKTMKSTMIMTMGAALLLLASCGGGGENQGTYTPPSAEETVKEADPKGVGEIKSVDIGATVDEALAEKGKAKMVIVAAGMRKLLHIIFGVLKNKKP